MNNNKKYKKNTKTNGISWVFSPPLRKRNFGTSKKTLKNADHYILHIRSCFAGFVNFASFILNNALGYQADFRNYQRLNGHWVNFKKFF